MISNGFLILTWFFMLFGIFGLFRLKGIYTRILSSSKIDSVTVITLFLALMIKTGWSVMTIKLAVILVFYMFTNPVTNQIIANSALRNGIKPDRFILDLPLKKRGGSDA